MREAVPGPVSVVTLPDGATAEIRWAGYGERCWGHCLDECGGAGCQGCAAERPVMLCDGETQPYPWQDCPECMADTLGVPVDVMPVPSMAANDADAPEAARGPRTVPLAERIARAEAEAARLDVIAQERRAWALDMRDLFEEVDAGRAVLDVDVSDARTWATYAAEVAASAAMGADRLRWEAERLAREAEYNAAQLEAARARVARLFSGEGDDRARWVSADGRTVIVAAQSPDQSPESARLAELLAGAVAAKDAGRALKSADIPNQKTHGRGPGPEVRQAVARAAQPLVRPWKAPRIPAAGKPLDGDALAALDADGVCAEVEAAPGVWLPRAAVYVAETAASNGWTVAMERRGADVVVVRAAGVLPGPVAGEVVAVWRRGMFNESRSGAYTDGQHLDQRAKLSRVLATIARAADSGTLTTRGEPAPYKRPDVVSDPGSMDSWESDGGAMPEVTRERDHGQLPPPGNGTHPYGYAPEVAPVDRPPLARGRCLAPSLGRYLDLAAAGRLWLDANAVAWVLGTKTDTPGWLPLIGQADAGRVAYLRESGDLVTVPMRGGAMLRPGAPEPAAPERPAGEQCPRCERYSLTGVECAHCGHAVITSPGVDPRPCPAAEAAPVDDAQGAVRPAASSSSAAPPASAPVRKKAVRGELRAAVAAFLAGDPTSDFSPHQVAKRLGRSAGAVGNALETLVKLGEARKTQSKPRRYSAATDSDGRPSSDLDHGPTNAPEAAPETDSAPATPTAVEGVVITGGQGGTVPGGYARGSLPKYADHPHVRAAVAVLTADPAPFPLALLHGDDEENCPDATGVMVTPRDDGRVALHWLDHGQLTRPAGPAAQKELAAILRHFDEAGWSTFRWAKTSPVVFAWPPTANTPSDAAASAPAPPTTEPETAHAVPRPRSAQLPPAPTTAAPEAGDGETVRPLGPTAWEVTTRERHVYEIEYAAKLRRKRYRAVRPDAGRALVRASDTPEEALAAVRRHSARRGPAATGPAPEASVVPAAAPASTPTPPDIEDAFTPAPGADRWDIRLARRVLTAAGFVDIDQDPDARDGFAIIQDGWDVGVIRVQGGDMMNPPRRGTPARQKWDAALNDMKEALQAAEWRIVRRNQVVVVGSAPVPDTPQTTARVTRNGKLGDFSEKVTFDGWEGKGIGGTVTLHSTHASAVLYVEDHTGARVGGNMPDRKTAYEFLAHHYGLPVPVEMARD